MPGARADRLYIDHRHAQRAYRERVKRAAKAAGLPASLNLQTVQAADTTTGHNGDGPTRRNRPQRRRTEVRLSYTKALAAAELAIHVAFADRARGGVLTPGQIAERLLREGLTSKQRELVEQKAA